MKRRESRRDSGNFSQRFRGSNLKKWPGALLCVYPSLYKNTHLTWTFLTFVAPQKALSISAPPRSTTFPPGDNLPCYFVKECNIYFIVPNDLFQTQLQYYITKIPLRTRRHFQWMSGSSGGRVVKLLACGAIGPGFASRPRHLNFQRLVISCFQVEIWLKDR